MFWEFCCAYNIFALAVFSHPQADFKSVFKTIYMKSIKNLQIYSKDNIYKILNKVDEYKSDDN